MPINDRFMLPRRVRTMAQMADLLAAEQMELTKTQHTVAALENQLSVSFSTFLLPRHERIFGLPINTTESLELRRARVLAKLNTHGTTTVEAVREMVRIVTGCAGDVEEHFATYAFSVIVRLLADGASPDIGELFRQIDEIKPAHLVFNIIGAVNPIVLENRNGMSLYRVRLLFAFFNARGQRVVRFNGEETFNGGILFDQALNGIGFPAMTVRTGIPVREKLRATVTVDNWYAFDGTVSFDGSRKFNAQITQEEI